MRKIFTMAGIGMLSMLIGIPALARAQDDQKPPRQEEPKQEEPKAEPKAEPRPDARQQEEKLQKQDEMKPPKHDDKRPEHAQQPDHSQRAEDGQQNARAANGRGGRIPDDKFRSHFGRGHTVVIRQPVIVEGQPRFQSGGYWFEIADPWPPEWSYSDECYIDYVDGEYYLFNLLHPGVRIALFVVM